MMGIDIRKYEGFFKSFMDELEMGNYISILKEAHIMGLISDDEYKEKLTKFIKSYESK